MDVETAAAICLCAASYYNYLNVYSKKKIHKPWRKRRWWMIAMHRNRNRITMENQLAELVAEPCGQFKKFTRMSSIDFEYLLQKISPMITKANTPIRQAIPAKIRLAISLRFLASGDSFESLHFLFKVSSSIISRIVPEVCIALNQVLKDQIRIPEDPQSWLQIEQGFRNFPRCIGAIDGKHIVMQSPVHSGSEYYNYKKSFSIVLLALVDSNYNFIFTEIGSQGRISDGGVFRNSKLWRRISSNNLNFPMPRPLPGSTREVPYVFLGDGAFALTTHVMKPYPGSHDKWTPKRIFNKKLSSSRVVVENAFGILASKFRIFRKPILLNPEKTTIIAMTCVLLHNFLRKSRTSSAIYTPPGTVDVYDSNNELLTPGLWRNEIEDTCAIRSLQQIPRRPAQDAYQIREEFTTYFVKGYNNTSRPSQASL
ncbi:uncharacterized protein LOC112053545 [Bicyclus anynana]|uniref:Uncharacterized protein LOC112053545 n=1 Tax=Bicyclus anynana TaxID=110368 RepID=A0ABM3LZD4_BICAN|nr:uncharacterized protein LOC112053545 [Bicyclus anynana]